MSNLELDMINDRRSWIEQDGSNAENIVSGSVERAVTSPFKR